MSLIQVRSQEISSQLNQKAVPAGTCIEQCVMLSRFMIGCSDLLQRDFYTELLLRHGMKRKRSRKSYKPFFPIKETLTVMPSRVKGYVDFSCRHYTMGAVLRYGIEPDLIRMFK